MCRAVAGSVCRWGTRRGACPAGRRLTVPFRNPQGACLLGYPPPLTLVCFFAPIPPAPFPSGEGGDYKFILPGASPPAPLHLTACGTYSPCHAGARRGCAFFAACCPLPLPSFLPPIPPAPFPSGEGGDYRFILPGASPPAPLHLTACDTYSSCHAGARRGLALGVASSAQNR